MLSKFTVSSSLSCRLDIALKDFFKAGMNYSRSHVQKMISLEKVNVNGLICVDNGYKVHNGDTIEINDSAVDNISAAEITQNANREPAYKEAFAAPAFKVVYESSAVLVVSKPPGLSTHRGIGTMHNNLAEQLANKYGAENFSSCNGDYKKGVVHRLDKDTSGLIIFVKNDEASLDISGQIQSRECKRCYLALCYGVMVPVKGRIVTGIKSNPAKHGHMMICAENDPEGKIAITDYATKEILGKGDISLIEFRLETGRTHQIRVHAFHKNHSIIGDKTYMPRNLPSLPGLNDSQKKLAIKFPRQALHAYKVDFYDSKNYKKVNLEIDLHEDMQNLYNQLKSL